VRHVLGWLAAFVATWWLWMLLAGEWNHTEWIAATAAAFVAATIGEAARSRARAAPGLPLHLVASVPSALGMVFVDFGIVLAALVRRREGTFVRGWTETAANAQTRAWGEYVATISPNAYVVDIDGETGVAVVHHLIRYQRSQEPV
jgi:hypothetical protein